MRSISLSLALGLAAVHALPFTSDVTGCRVDLAATASQPQNAGETILFSIMKKWIAATSMEEFSSEYLDAQSIVKAPFYVVFKAGVIPGYESLESLEDVLDPWVGTFLIGGAKAAGDDYVVTGVTCS